MEATMPVSRLHLGNGTKMARGSTVQVLKSDKASSADHWMWVRVAGPPGQRLILFDYDASRGSHVTARLLEGTRGYLQSDGYAGYDAVAAQLHLMHLGCFAHARR